MITGLCRTYLDEFKREDWPEVFCGVPRLGDFVESKSGKRLRVVGITHCQKFRDPYKPIPFIQVELNTP